MICVSRSSPNFWNNLFGRRRISCQAGSGSTSRITAATDRHLRIATRRSWTASLSGDCRRLSSSLSTRCIQCVNPRCSARAPGRAVTVAIDASERPLFPARWVLQLRQSAYLQSFARKEKLRHLPHADRSTPRINAAPVEHSQAYSSVCLASIPGSVEILSTAPPRAIFVAGPEWRNWQTQQTQNLPELCSVWVRLPPPGPFSRIIPAVPKTVIDPDSLQSRCDHARCSCSRDSRWL